jgi:[CysO sulfur-carrier protein]-S-L-cysteine hydrolase
MRGWRNGNRDDRRGELIAKGPGRVRIRVAVLSDMAAHARQDAPDECCGLLVGSSSLLDPPYTNGVIDEAVRSTNLERTPTRYRIDPAEHVALVKRLRGTSRAIAGAYHSHPGTAPVPSASDLSEAFYPDFLYVIVSLARSGNPEIRAWRIREGTATEVTLALEP